jgi:hypothetical protein
MRAFVLSGGANYGAQQVGALKCCRARPTAGHANGRFGRRLNAGGLRRIPR